MKRHMERIERIMGLLLWTIGLLMLTGGFSRFSYWLLEIFPAMATLANLARKFCKPGVMSLTIPV